MAINSVTEQLRQRSRRPSNRASVCPGAVSMARCCRGMTTRRLRWCHTLRASAVLALTVVSQGWPNGARRRPCWHSPCCTCAGTSTSHLAVSRELSCGALWPPSAQLGRRLRITSGARCHFGCRPLQFVVVQTVIALFTGNCDPPPILSHHPIVLPSRRHIAPKAVPHHCCTWLVVLATA